MKNLTKIFMAVAVALFAFSCVQDATEDLGIKVEGQGVTELTLSLEESRTHLGDKVVNEDGTSLYPLYWSEGDAISVNGEVSLPLSGVATDATSATFQFYKEVARPYCVVYPAKVGAGEGTIYPVTFAATQPYTVGTFAPQAAPMYGYAAVLADGEEEAPIQLNHLTGVLRLAIKGNGEKVTSIKVKAEKGAIAGAFTVDCTTGVLTPAEDASNTVTVTFAEPLVLGAEAQTVYLTVPAGSYGTFLITVNTEAHQKMTVKFSSDVKPINAGAVREFAEFAYAANTDDEEGVFEIDSKDALIKFARLASSQNLYPYTSAKVTADIDMTGYDWTPIEGFGAYEFDGGNFTIKGLNAPLFGTTSATIKNVKLTDVNISFNTPNGSKGSLVNVFKGGSVTNCEVSGSISVTDPADEYSYGGIIGLINGSASVSELVNRCNVSASISNNQNIHVGGILGRAYAALEISNCSNYATVNISGANTAITRIGGIIGYISTVGITAEDLNNYGVVTVTHAGGADSHVGGVCGSITANSTFKNSYNRPNGKVSVNGAPGGSSTGGFIGYSSGAVDLDNCHNCDSVKINLNNTSQNMLGGIIAYNNNSTEKTIKNSSNSGVICALGQTTNHVRAGGFSGYSYSKTTIENSTNSGDVYIEMQSKAAFVGGFCGYAGSNVGTDLTNSGKITYAGTATTEAVRIGGCYGNASGTLSNLTNTGEIAVTGSAAKDYLYVGGIVGLCSASVDIAENRGTLTLQGSAVKNYLAGGIVGHMSGGISNATNYGVLNCGGSTNVTYFAGGVAGYLANSTSTNLTNETTGIINFTATAVQNHNVGGVIGCVSSADVTTLTNKAALTYSGHTSTGNKVDGDNNTICVGGVLGAIFGTESALKTAKDLTNSGVVTLSNFKTDGELKTAYSNFGGVIGYATYCNLDNCDNTATKFTQASSATITKLEAGSNLHQVRLGGVVGYAPDMGNITNCDNSAELDLNAPNAIHHRVGGLFGSANATVTKCTNSGKLSLNSKFYTKRLGVGGIAGGFSGSVSECSNSGDIEYTNNQQVTNQFYLGGVIGTTAAPIDACVSTGSITLGDKCATSSAATYIGGVVGYHTGSGVVVANSTFTGNMTMASTIGPSNPYIGGIAGRSSVVVDNCQSYSDIKALNLSGKVGLILGHSRTDTIKATNCKIGGNLIFATDTGVDASGEEETVDVKTPITADNFFEHIYTGAITADVASADGCSALETKPSVE